MHKFIVANYKMNGSSKFYKGVAKKINNTRIKDTKIILCPPFVYLPNFKIKNRFTSLGSQDIAHCENGKSTGQISAKMLKEFNVKYSIIGHSERRELGELDNMVARKVKNAKENGIVPIVCVGELKKNSALDSVISQVEAVLNVLDAQDNVIFAYEPVWAIGSGETPTIKRINKVVEAIKNKIVERNIEPICLYGGSVNVDNYKELNTANIEGFLIGGTSLKVDKFIEILKGVDNE